MWSVVVFKAILFSLFGLSEGTDFSALFKAFKNHTSSNKLAATKCSVFRNRRRCKLNTNTIDLDVGGVIELIVNEGGRTIKCSNKNTKGFGKWYGTCDGDADDANFVKKADKYGNELLFGSIHVGNEVCQIAPSINGDSEILCTPENDFKVEDFPLQAPNKEYPRELRKLQFGFTPSTNQTDTRRALFDDSGANIDILVVWTMEAECRYAGLAVGCTVTPESETRMRGLIDLAVAETNTAYELSGILTALRLVHAYRDPEYIETTSYGTSLNHLTNTNDGFLDSVHVKRALYGADIVHMIVGATEYCGLGWFGAPSKSYMFAITRFSCATGYYSFGHEIGHNFNLNHDKGIEGACGAAASNYGYKNPAAEFRTILSYNCQMGQCDNMPKDGCSRIQRFSNSNSAYTYNGNVIGDAGRDNVKEFNKHRALVASFFPAMDCQSHSECNDGDSKTADTCNTVTRVCVFTPIVTSPTKAPTASPTKVPTNTPVSIPVAVSAPSPVAVALPTKAPTRPPTKMPTRPPTKAPTRSPTKAPTKAPIIPPQKYFMESLTRTGITSSAWTTVTLSKTFTSPIAVCSVKYDTGTSLLPAIVRLQNVGPTAFDIRLQNPSGTNLSGRDVHCVVVEEGAWKMPDGRLIEAKKYSSTVTDNAASWVGQTQAYTNRYTKPVILGQVMSYNDAKWSVFWSRASSSRANAPTTTSIITGKQVGEDRTTTRAAETVGFIVIESGHATSNSIEVETGRGPDAFVGYVNKKVTYKFTAAFATTPAVAVLCQAAQDSTDGSWAVLSSNPTTTSMIVNVDEDQIKDTERSHSTEEVNYAVFAVAGGIELTKI